MTLTDHRCIMAPPRRRNDLVSTVLGIPRVMESPYPYTAGTAPSQTDMLTLFCGEHTIWPHGILKVKSASFIPEYRRLNRIVCTTNLFPIAHLSTLQLPRAQLLYALITNVPIDICRHICQVIIDALTGHVLYSPSLVSLLSLLKPKRFLFVLRTFGQSPYLPLGVVNFNSAHLI